MSNKNLGLTKTRFDEGTKTSNSGIFQHKIQQQHSPKHIPKQVGKNYKITYISRHASQEELKRVTPTTKSYSHLQHPPTTHSVEDQYQMSPNTHNKLLHFDSKRTKTAQNNDFYATRTNNKEKIQHQQVLSSYSGGARRMSPHTPPMLFRSKPKLIVKEAPQVKPLSRNNFKIITKLGEGKFGKVYLVRQIYTGFIMALKVLEKKKIMQDSILQQFIRELKIQAFLDHPNIIGVYGFFHDEIYFYTLLQLGSDGQLYNIIAQHKNLTQEGTSFIVKNLLEAVNCMHNNKILHRDIKPENIVLIMGNVKLCDFGWAVNKVKKEELRSTFCGTPLYLSPELLKGYKYDEKVDLWAIGILAYQLLIGCSPFEINQQQDLYKILTDQVKFPKSKKISSQFQEFIHFILNKNPKERLPSSDLLRLQFIRKYEQFQTCEELCS